jgi:hypothetical protein
MHVSIDESRANQGAGAARIRRVRRATHPDFRDPVSLNPKPPLLGAPFRIFQ